jgi:alpha-beta hydrolase superfamily lysophospholipase
VSEAVEVGKAIGDNILLMGTSTGAALVLRYMDVAPLVNSSVRSLILLSPNYKVAAFGAEILGNKFGRSLARILVGSHREFAPENELHGDRWTTKYRSEALHELLLVTLSARGVPLENLKIPVLTVYTKNDEVVSVAEIEKRAADFRDPRSVSIDWQEGQRHLLASDTFHPEKVESLVNLMSDWVSKLKVGPWENQNKSGD